MEKLINNYFKIVLISDTHEFEKFAIPEADILIHAGYETLK